MAVISRIFFVSYSVLDEAGDGAEAVDAAKLARTAKRSSMEAARADIVTNAEKAFATLKGASAAGETTISIAEVMPLVGKVVDGCKVGIPVKKKRATKATAETEGISNDTGNGDGKKRKAASTKKSIATTPPAGTKKTRVTVTPTEPRMNRGNKGDQQDGEGGNDAPVDAA